MKGMFLRGIIELRLQNDVVFLLMLRLLLLYLCENGRLHEGPFGHQ